MRKAIGWILWSLKPLLLIGMIVCMLSSCSTAKWCSTHCSKVIKDSTVVVKKDSLVRRDSTVYIPRDSVHITFKDSVPCSDFETNATDGKGGKVRIKVVNHILTVDAECEDAKVKLSWFEHHYTELKEHWHSEYSPPVVIKKHWMSFWQSWLCCGLILVFITGLILKKLHLKLALQLSPPFITITKSG